MLGNTNVTRIRGGKKGTNTHCIKSSAFNVIYPVTKFDRVCVCVTKYYMYIYIYPLFLFPDPDKPEGYDEPHSQQTRISKRSIVKTKVYFRSDSYNACARTISSTGFHLRDVSSPCIVCRGIRIEYTWINLKTAGQSNFTSAFVKLNLNEAGLPESNVTGEGRINTPCFYINVRDD